VYAALWLCFQIIEVASSYKSGFSSFSTFFDREAIELRLCGGQSIANEGQSFSKGDGDGLDGKARAKTHQP